MLCLRALPPASVPLRRKPSSLRAAMSSIPALATSPVEHVVLFKVRPDATAAVTDAMVRSLQALSTLPGVTYLHVGPVLRLRSPAAEALGHTHVLHSRHTSQPELAAYYAHPSHLGAVETHVFPNCDDVTAVDWVNASAAPSPVGPGSAVRLTLAKANAEVEAKQLVEQAAAEGDEKAAVSFGENFSPERAKGYQFGMVAVSDTVEKLDAVEAATAAVKPLLEEVFVVDFVVEAPAPASH